jgi:hypothetical protein
MLYTVLPLGVPSLVNAADPLYARRLLPADDTAVKVPALTPEPHVRAPEETPQEPLDVFMVNPEESPESVMVASV